MAMKVKILHSRGVIVMIMLLVWNIYFIVIWASIAEKRVGSRQKTNKIDDRNSTMVIIPMKRKNRGNSYRVS